VSEVDPEVSVSASARMSESFDEDPVELPPSTGKKPEREGLPPGYRMRADAHYVEHLTSRRGEKAAAEHPRAVDPVDRSERADARERMERLFAQLTEDIATIESAAAALSAETSRVSRRVNVDLIKAQAWRAAWALRAQAIVDGSYRPRIRPRPLGFLLGHVRTGWAAECRLEDITLDVAASDWNAVVAVDEQGVMAALTGAIIATLGLIEQVDGATISIRAASVSGEFRALEVVQDDVLVSPGISGRFFDGSWAERPGGWSASLGAAVVKAVAHHHGGEAVFLAGDRRGSTVKITFGK
jgi:hypothetical protein